LRGALITIAVIGGLLVLGVVGVIDYVIGHSTTLVSNATDPVKMQQEYSDAHSQCAGVRGLLQQLQTDDKAAKDYDTANADILAGRAKDTPLGQVHNQSAQLHTVAQGDRDQLAEAASGYDNMIEDHTKSLGITWVKTVFLDHGLPQSIQPPDYTVDCGTGSWQNNG